MRFQVEMMLRPPTPPRKQSPVPERPYKKRAIPQAVREAVWIYHCGRVFSAKCTVEWCRNEITVYDFQAGHNIPESKGGETTVDNLRPICSRCNLSMGDRYTIDEWNATFRSREVPVVHSKKFWKCLFCR